MSAYELIKDLEKKLSLYRDQCPAKPSPPPDTTHELIASLICKAELYPSRLTKSIVKNLIEDRVPWPTADGLEYYLSQSVKVEILERARLISFPNDDLCVQRTMQVSEDMPLKLRNEINAHQFLYDIRYDGGDLSSPHLRLPKYTVTNSEIILLGNRIKSEGDYLKINIEDHDIYGVGTFLWKHLRIHCHDLDTAFSEYVVRMRIATKRPYVFEIDFDHAIDLEEFLDCALSYIKSDQTLVEDWPSCAADIALSYNGPESLTHQIYTNDSNVNTYVDTLSLQPLQGVIRNMLNRPKTTLLEGAVWFKENARGGYDDRDRIADNLVGLIIRHEYNCHSSHESFSTTRALIEYSRTAPKLINLLFSHVSNPSYLCFLLNFRPTSHIGLISLYLNSGKTARRISTKVNYEKIWQDLVWTQGLEVYCSGVENGLDYTQVTNLLESIGEMIVWFVDHEVTRSSRTQSIAETRLPSIKAAITDLTYLTNYGHRNNLFEDHLALIGKLANGLLSRAMASSNAAPLGSWLLLFWSIEIAEKRKSLDAELPVELTRTLINSYLKVLQNRRLGEAGGSDDPLALDELNWSRLLSHMSKSQRRRWLNSLSSWEVPGEEVSASESSKLNSAVRLHVRVLLKIYDDSVDDAIRRDIAEEICSIVERFGFASDKHSGALDYMNDNSNYSPLHLWSAICDLVNDFSDEAYDDLLEMFVRQQIPLSALLAILDRTIQQERKDKLSALVNLRDLKSEKQYWVPEIFDLSIKAANNGHIHIAQFFLKSIRDGAHKSHKNNAIELLAKIELKEIFDSTHLAALEKLDRLMNYKADAEEQEVNRSVREYKNFLIATINVSLDRNKAIEQFSRLVKTSPTLQNATGLVRCAVSAPTQTEAAVLLINHEDAWMGVFEAHLHRERVEFADEHLHSVLQACLVTSRLSEFGQFWGMASSRQRASYQFADVRSEYLTKSGRRQEAIDYIQKLIAKLGDSSQSARSELTNLESGLLEPASQLQPQIAQIPVRAIWSMHMDLRSSWLRIRALGARDQSQIFMEPTNSIDSYLLEVIEHIGTELLMRNANLMRKKPPAKSGDIILLDDEDMINDWMVSLLRQKMSFIGWTVHEQSRMGWSASGLGVGETDGWIQDSKGSLTSIIEAFRQGQRIDKTVIKDHLDKIFNYNSPGISPVFIIVYTSSDDFSGLCSDYISYVRSLQYKGFDAVTPDRLNLMDMNTPKAQARYYEEARYMNGSKITIYHQLLNLRVAPQ